MWGALRRVFNKLPSQDGIRTCEMWARPEGMGTILTNMQQHVRALYEIRSAWCWRRRRRRGIAICITIVRNWLLHLGLINTASWYSSPNKKKSEWGLWRLPYFYKVVAISITILGRAIMVRDANRFHYFEDGILFLHGLLVMPVLCLVNHDIKFILFLVACLVLL